MGASGHHNASYQRVCSFPEESVDERGVETPGLGVIACYPEQSAEAEFPLGIGSDYRSGKVEGKFESLVVGEEDTVAVGRKQLFGESDDRKLGT